MKKSRVALDSLAQHSAVDGPKSRPSLLSAFAAVGLGGSLAAFATRRKQPTSSLSAKPSQFGPSGSTSSGSTSTGYASSESSPVAGSTSTGATSAALVADRTAEDDTKHDQAPADDLADRGALDIPEDPPAPDDDRKPDSPTDLTRRSWIYVLKRTVREFGDDHCTDLAAALTYYAVLSLFPAAIALLSVLGVVGRADQSVDTIKKVLKPLLSDGAVTRIGDTLDNLTNAPGAGLLLVVGLLGALWTASGYVGAFGRAMNRIYEVGEGRPIWVLRPLQMLITLVMVVTLAVALVIIVISGPLAESIGSVIGLGNTGLQVWNIAKWPVLGLLAVLLVALLYYATPNIKQPRFRWISVGAVVALSIWVLASVGFTFYVTNFGSYNKTYGALAGVVVALLFLWISNVALLFGAEIDSELERGRQLQAGLPAEIELQLPVRSSRNIDKAKAKEAEDIKTARQIRADSGVDWSEPEPEPESRAASSSST